MTFLEDMYQLMQAAHFRLLSADDWKTAQAEQFTVILRQHPEAWLNPSPVSLQALACDWAGA